MICCFTVKSFLNMSLPTAGMVVGWVSMVINLFQTGIIVKSDEIIEFARTRSHSMPEFIDGSSVGISFLLTLSLLDLIASVLLIIGVNKRNHLFLLPWLINNGISLTIKMFFGIGLIILALNSEIGSAGPWAVVLILSILGFLCMVWNAIYSLFQSIRKANEQDLLDTERLVGSPRSCSYELFKNTA